MASQPIVPFAAPTYRQPQPAVRIAFVAGEATQAVDAAIAPFSDAVKQASLEELATAPVIGRDQYPLPVAGLKPSPTFRAFMARYEAAFRGEGGEDCADHWDGVAREMAAAPPMAPADAAVKMMYALHYLHPSDDAGTLAIDTTGFEINGAGEMLIATMNELVATALSRSASPSFSTWSKEKLIYERAEAAMEACPAEPCDAFDELAVIALYHRMNMFTTAAPTVTDLAYKLAEYNRTQAWALLCADEIAQALEADARRLAVGHLATDAEWQQAVAAFDAARAAVNAGDLSDEEVDRLADIEMDAASAVMALPSRTIADAATKLRIQMTIATMVDNDDLVGVVADLDRLGRETIEIGGGNPDLLHAFTEFRDAFGALKGEPWNAGTATVNYHLARMDRADVALKSAPSFTPADVSMKLKRAFVGIVEEAWSDHAVLDERPVEFDRGVALTGMYQAMFWEAIDELDRIAGGNLTGQGA